MGLIETFRSVAFAGALLVAATSVADETQSLQKEASILEMGVVKAVAPPTEIENEVANQNAANQAITPKSLESRSVLTKESDNEPQSVPTPAEPPQSVITPETEIGLATEVINERYPNRKVKVSRSVVQTSTSDYINHGPWRYWDPNGALIAEGTYRFGKRHGVWTRQHLRSDSVLFKTASFNEAKAPFISQAEFRDGQLDGTWVISDANGTALVRWQFSTGQRRGEQMWYYPDGKVLQSFVYKDGLADGPMIIRNSDGQIVDQIEFEGGRQRITEVTYYEGTKNKKSQGGCLLSVVKKTKDDWWKALPATFESVGKPIKHGKWIVWYPSGQRALEGEFKYGKPEGQFHWWYPSGQVALEGVYNKGHAEGEWIWRHENGLRRMHGSYVAGAPMGEWLWWRDDGKLAHQSDFSSPKANVAQRLKRQNVTPRKGPIAPSPGAFSLPKN